MISLATRAKLTTLLQLAYTCTAKMSGQQQPRLGWTVGLCRRGVYYEGYTESLAELLTAHSVATVSTYGVRRSYRPGSAAPSPNDKESSDLDQSAAVRASPSDHATSKESMNRPTTTVLCPSDYSSFEDKTPATVLPCPRDHSSSKETPATVLPCPRDHSSSEETPVTVLPCPRDHSSSEETPVTVLPCPSDHSSSNETPATTPNSSDLESQICDKAKKV